MWRLVVMKKIVSKFLILMVISVSVLFAFEKDPVEAATGIVDPLAFDSLAFYWKFDGTAIDSGVKSADLSSFLTQFNSAPLTSANYVGGIINQAVHLGSNSNIVTPGNNSAVIINSIKAMRPEFTISFYIKQDATTLIPNPQWKHVLIRSNGTVEVYVDNVSTTASTLDSWINGKITIDDLRIYRRYLLDSEVSQLYVPVLAKRIHTAPTPGVSLEEIVKYMKDDTNLRRDDLTRLLGLIAPKS
jgi:hypothetical protein